MILASYFSYLCIRCSFYPLINWRSSVVAPVPFICKGCRDSVSPHVSLICITDRQPILSFTYVERWVLAQPLSCWILPVPICEMHVLLLSLICFWLVLDVSAKIHVTGTNTWGYRGYLSFSDQSTIKNKSEYVFTQPLEYWWYWVWLQIFYGG